MKNKYKIYLAHFVVWIVLSIVIFIISYNSFFEFCFWHFTYAAFFYFIYFIISPAIVTKPTLKRIVVWFLVSLILYYLFLQLRNDFFVTFINTSIRHDVLVFDFGEEFVGYLSFAPQSLGLRLYHDWLLNESENEELELRKSAAQLQSYKNKMDLPAMNNILDKMQQMASVDPSSVQDTIIQLSNILRYNIYESLKEGVTLGQELEVVKNQLSLNKKLYKEEVNLSFSEKWDHVLIEPGVVLKIVTEFLKINPKGEFMNLTVIDNKLYLTVEDSKDQLKTLKQRLKQYIPQLITSFQSQTYLKLELTTL